MGKGRSMGPEKVLKAKSAVLTLHTTDPVTEWVSFVTWWVSVNILLTGQDICI